MKIARVGIENFLSFQDHVEVDLVDLGLTLVEGVNGAGKSTIVDAVTWCLHGVTLRGYDGDEVVNRTTGRDCKVVVHLVDDHGQAWQVLRCRRDAEFKNKLLVHQGLTDHTRGTNQETQAVVDKLLGMTLTTFLNSVVFGQSAAYRFSLLTDKEQKAVFDEALGLEAYAQAHATAREEMRAESADVERLEEELEHSVQRLAECEETMVDLVRKQADHDEDRRTRIKAEREKAREVQRLIDGVAHPDPDALERAIAALHVEIEALEEDYDEKRVLVDGVVDELREAEVAVRQADREAKRHESLRGTCPTCDQVIDAAHQARVVTGWRREEKGARRTHAAIQERVDVGQAMVNTLREDVAKRKDQLRTANDALAKALKTTAQVETWKERKRAHKERAAAIEAEASPYVELYEREVRRRTGLAEKIATARERVKEAEAQLRVTAFWVEAFGTRGVRSLLVDTALPLLNAKAATYARALTDGDIDVSFRTQSELKSGKTVDRFEVVVDNRRGAGSYRGLSAGERGRVDLIVGLSLQALVAHRAKVAFNVAFFDEPFEHIDKATHERVVEVLASLDRESVLVVTHDDDLKSYFPHVIRVWKDEHGSHID